MTSIYILLLLSIVGTINVNAAIPDENDVIRTLQAALNCHNNPAMTVAIVKDGKVVLSKGFGTKEKEGKGGPVTDSTLFGIASLSKAFAATLVVKLLHETKR